MLLVIKYHIKADGTPGICRAAKGNCPLSTDENHYKTQEEAQVAADKIMSEKHSVFSEGKMPPILTKRQMNSLNIREERVKKAMDELDEAEETLKNQISESKDEGTSKVQDVPEFKKQHEEYMSKRYAMTEEFYALNDSSDVILSTMVNPAFGAYKAMDNSAKREQLKVDIEKLDKEQQTHIDSLDGNDANEYSERMKAYDNYVANRRTHIRKLKSIRMNSKSKDEERLMADERLRFSEIENNYNKLAQEYTSPPKSDTPSNVDLGVAKGRVTRKKRMLEKQKQELSDFRVSIGLDPEVKSDVVSNRQLKQSNEKKESEKRKTVQRKKHELVSREKRLEELKTMYSTKPNSESEYEDSQIQDFKMLKREGRKAVIPEKNRLSSMKEEIKTFPIMFKSKEQKEVMSKYKQDLEAYKKNNSMIDREAHRQSKVNVQARKQAYRDIDRKIKNEQALIKSIKNELKS